MKTLLVISDKIINLKLTNELCSECSVVDSVSSALEAYHYLNRNEYDMAVIDCELPDLDGLLIAKRLVKEDGLIKIVMLSSANNFEICDDLDHSNLFHLKNSQCEKEIVAELKKKNIL